MTQLIRSIPALPILAGLLLIGTPILILVLARTRRRPGPASTAVWTTSLRDGLLVAGMVGVLWVMLVPSPGLAGHHYFDTHPHGTLRDEITGVVGVDQGLAQVGGNLLVFAALGVLAPLRWRSLDSFVRLLIAAALAAASIETLQYVIGGRVASIGDWMLNVAGAGLGYFALRLWRRIRSRRSTPKLTRAEPAVGSKS